MSTLAPEKTARTPPQASESEPALPRESQIELLRKLLQDDSPEGLRVCDQIGELVAADVLRQADRLMSSLWELLEEPSDKEHNNDPRVKLLTKLLDKFLPERRIAAGSKKGAGVSLVQVNIGGGLDPRGLRDGS